MLSIITDRHTNPKSSPLKQTWSHLILSILFVPLSINFHHLSTALTNQDSFFNPNIKRNFENQGAKTVLIHICNMDTNQATLLETKSVVMGENSSHFWFSKKAWLQEWAWFNLILGLLSYGVQEQAEMDERLKLEWYFGNWHCDSSLWFCSNCDLCFVWSRFYAPCC